MLRLCVVLLIAVVGTIGCKRDPAPMSPKEGELPPLPPASGTAVGYLVDSAGKLQLTDDQLSQLKAIDVSLSAKNDTIDTQLRAIERPDEEPAQKGQPPPRHNNAPGAQIRTTPDAQKLHKARADNDREALAKAFAILDEAQQATATRLLDERGIQAPPTPAAKSPEPAAPATAP